MVLDRNFLLNAKSLYFYFIFLLPEGISCLISFNTSPGPIIDISDDIYENNITKTIDVKKYFIYSIYI